MRLRRIKGQVEALERAVEAGTDCSALLQQIAALRGATNGLMAEVLDSHVRELFSAMAGEQQAAASNHEIGAASAQNAKHVLNQKGRGALHEPGAAPTPGAQAESTPDATLAFKRDAEVDALMKILRTYLK